MIAVCAWLCWTLIIGQYIKIIIDDLFQWLNHGKQLFAHGYFTAGILGFGCIDDNLCMLFLSLNDVDAFNGTANGYRTVHYIDIAPLQSTYFTDTQPCTKADINTKPVKVKWLWM